MKKLLVLPVVLSVIVSGFGFPSSAFAIINEPIDITSLGDEVGIVAETVNGATVLTGTTIETPDQAGAAPVALGAGAIAAILWATMTPSDLGVDSVGTLPSSPFYFLKEWKRGLTRLFTFGSIAKAQLELNITNQIAAEVLEVSKAHPDDAEALKKALQNFTNAQERLNFRITTINGTSNVVDSERLLKDVDEKTAKQAALLEQLIQTWYSTGAGEQNVFYWDSWGNDGSAIIKNAQNNIQKTFTITVTPVGDTISESDDEPSLKQKAADQIESAEEAVKQAVSVYGQAVTFADTTISGGDQTYTDPYFITVNTATVLTVGDVIRIDNELLIITAMTPASIAVNRGEKGTISVVNIDGVEGPAGRTIVIELSEPVPVGQLTAGTHTINAQYSGSANFIANAKNHLANAKEAFAEEKYGETYGLARSAEAIVSGIFVSGGATQLQQSKEQRTDESKPAASPETSLKEKEKTSENELLVPSTTVEVPATTGPTSTELDIEGTPTSLQEEAGSPAL